MTQYRISDKTEDRLRGFLAKKYNGGREWEKRRGNHSLSYHSFSFDDAIQELLTEVGF